MKWTLHKMFDQLKWINWTDNQSFFTVFVLCLVPNPQVNPKNWSKWIFHKMVDQFSNSTLPLQVVCAIQQRVDCTKNQGFWQSSCEFSVLSTNRA